MYQVSKFRYCLGALFAVTLNLLAGAAQAQGPGSGGPQPDPVQPTDVPIDGGASLLLAGGAAYALHRLRRNTRPTAAAE